MDNRNDKDAAFPGTDDTRTVQQVSDYIKAQNAQAEPVTFEQAWATYKAKGYQYGSDALEQVRFGWNIAQEFAAPQPAVPKPLTEPEPECSTHPDAPHGFNRNASHNAGRYVCDCEGWALAHGIRETKT